MRRKRWIRGIGLILILALFGCQSSIAPKPAGGDHRTLVITDSQEPPNLDVSKSTDVVSGRILNNVMEGLLRFDQNQKAQPAVARSLPTISSDQLTYTFHLRDTKWSDGKPVRAQDFEYSWKRTLNPKTRSEYAFILFPIKNAEEYHLGKAKEEDVGVKALDDKTLQVTLRAPTPYFTDLTAFSTYQPLRKDIVEKSGDRYAQAPETMVYNGPFQLTEWKHDASLTMKKNPYYWDKDRVKLETVEVKIIKEVSTGVNLYYTNLLDFTFLSQDFADLYRGKPDYTVIKQLSTRYMELNQTQNFFKNRKIRQSIDYAINKRVLVGNVLNDGSIPAGGLVPPTIKANDHQSFRSLSPIEPRYDPQKAKQLYQEGLKELGLTKQPRVFEVVGDDTDRAKKLMEYLKEQLRVTLGMEIKVTAVPFKQRLDRGKKQQFDLLIGGWNGDYNDPQTFTELFLSDSPFNRGKWANSRYDQLVKKAATHPDHKQRTQLQIEAEKILRKEMGVIPLYHEVSLAATKPFVKGMYWNLVGQSYTLKEAWIDWREQ